MSLLKAMLMGEQEAFQDMFKAVTYVGTGTERSITGVGFQPDLVWVKERSSTSSHQLHDAVRGAGWELYSNSTSGEQDGTTVSVLSFDEDGFTLGTSTGVNEAEVTYVAWCFKADGTSGSSNTDGSITSTVSAGEVMSIVKYTGTGANATVGHGLPTAPKRIIVKRLDSADSWPVYDSILGATDYVYLDLTNVAASSITIWNNTEPTDSLFTVGIDGAVNASGGEYIAYCFAEKPEVSDMGEYTGDGTTTLAVDCGFQPAYVIIKCYEGYTTGYWSIWDNKRDTHNPIDTVLFANSNIIEENGTEPIDFTATGFVIKGTNQQYNDVGSEYIYMAFAELPTESSPENRDEPLFNQIAYTGDGTVYHPIDGYGFKPDLEWLKNRDVADSHQLFDALRGPGLSLVSNTTAAEASDLNTLMSFNADGVALGNDVKVNTNGEDYIAWGWNAGGEAVPNDEGSIHATVMANVSGGFSIIKATTTAGVDTIGHGLDTAPDIFMIKLTNTTSNWTTYVKELGSDKYLLLNTTGAEGTGVTVWDDTDPTDSVLTIGSGMTAGDYIIYCWTSKSGLSDISSYVGNGSTTGPVIDCGFKPDWLMIKRTIGGGGNWIMLDARRGIENKYLLANVSSAEGTLEILNLTDTGFQIVSTDTDVNASGSTYIYMAFKATDRTDTLHQVETGDLLLEGEVDPIVDTNTTHTITQEGDVTVSDVEYACGAKSIIFDGAGDYLTAPSSSDFEFGSGDFTVDWWEWRGASATADGSIYRSDVTYSPWMFNYFTASTMTLYGTSNGSSWDIFNGVTVCAAIQNAWAHYSYARHGNTFYVHQNGILQAELAITAAFFASTDPLSIGKRLTGEYTGYFDHIRITKGLALWTTTNFNLTDKGLYYPSGTLQI